MTNSKLEKIRDEMAENEAILPSCAAKNSYSIEWNTQVNEKFKKGFDASTAIHQQQIAKLIEALEFLKRNTNSLDYRHPVIDQALNDFKAWSEE